MFKIFSMLQGFDFFMFDFECEDDSFRNRRMNGDNDGLGYGEGNDDGGGLARSCYGFCGTQVSINLLISFTDYDE
jgi:hypothetical protein